MSDQREELCQCQACPHQAHCSMAEGLLRGSEAEELLSLDLVLFRSASFSAGAAMREWTGAGLATAEKLLSPFLLIKVWKLSIQEVHSLFFHSILNHFFISFQFE